MKEFKQLITPEEAMELSMFVTVDKFVMGNDIAVLFCDEKPLTKGSAPFLFGTVFEAGRIQGIREERRKKNENR